MLFFNKHSDKNNFIKYIRDEIDFSIKRIHQLQITELGFITGLFSLSSLKWDLNLKLLPTLVLIIPLIGFAFEVFVINERSRLHRVCKFIANEKLNKCAFEKDIIGLWEKYVENTPVMYESFAHLLINILLIFSSGFLFVYLNDFKSYKLFLLLFFSTLLPLSFLLFIAHFCVRCSGKEHCTGLFCVFANHLKAILKFFAPCSTK